MKILIVIGPAFGVINHTLALSHLLFNIGRHEVIWLTGYSSREHLRKMHSSYDTYYSDIHDLRFNADNPGKTPHFIFSCKYDYLKASIEYEIDLISKLKPDLIITKHHYSPTISARLFNLPHAYYYTDGAEYFFEERNPHNRWKDNTLVQDYQNVATYFGLTCEEKKYATEYLFSPFLNIIRGVPILSSLTKNEKKSLPDNCIFGGALTYDGPEEEFSDILDNISTNVPLIYVTFGTHCYQKERIKIILDGLANIDAYVFISTMSIDPREFYPISQNFFITRYIPNKLIIKKADLVIHHAGYGTTLTCYSSGVPQIVIPNNPNYSAQVNHAKMIERHGCGKYLSYEDFTTGKIRMLIEEILMNRSYKKNALRIKKATQKQDILCKKDLLGKLNILNY